LPTAFRSNRSDICIYSAGVHAPTPMPPLVPSPVFRQLLWWQTRPGSSEPEHQPASEL
jgi:hypothetical protein